MAVDLKKLIDIDLLAYFKSKIDLLFAGKVDKVDGKGLSTNDYTTAEKTKLAGIAAGAQVNTLEGVQVNGSTVTPTNKIANISVPTKTSDISNDSGFITAEDIPAGVQPSSTTPKADGTAATGTETKYARGDHVHPSDNTKVDKVAGKGLSTNDYTTAEKNKLKDVAEGAQVNVIESIKKNGVAISPVEKAVDISVPTKTSDITNDSGFITAADIPAGVQPSTTTPKMAGTAAVGTETKYAKGDHVHPHDSTKVDKVDGKGLSTNDYTTNEKSKLAGIEEGAEKNVVTAVSVDSDDNVVIQFGIQNGSTSSVVVSAFNFYSALQNAQTIISSKANASDVYDKTEIDQMLVGAMNYKGTKATTSALPSSGNTQGDVWHVTADGSEWAWNGSAWEELGSAVDLSGYVEEDDLGLATTDDIDGLFT